VRELLVRPLGLVTRPNIYAQYPLGGLSQALNLVMRAPGILEAAPATVLGLSWGATNDVVHDIVPVNAAVISTTLSGSTWTLRRNGSLYTNPTTAGAITYSATGTCQRVVARGRVFLNSVESGLLVIDDPNNAPSSTSLRQATLPQPTVNNFGGLSTNGLALVGPNVTAGYTFIVRRVFSDGYELASEPSPIYVFYNSLSSTLNATARIECSSFSGYRAGDIVEMYRTNIVSSSTAQTDPGTSCQLVASHVLTSADITAVFIIMVDSTQPGPLGVTAGKALYANPGFEGATAANLTPNLFKAMAFYKTYMFYGNLTELPLLQFTVPAAIAQTSASGFGTAAWRALGIGERQLAGTVTLGSPTITGISAADIVGLKIGQRYVAGVGGATFPIAPATYIIAVGATSITMGANATAGGTGVFVVDTIEIDSVPVSIGYSPLEFVQSMARTGGTINRYRISTSENAVEGQNPTTGIPKIEFFIQPSRWNRNNVANTMTVRATNGANYDPPLPEYTASVQTLTPKTFTADLQWSKDNQPEHCPAPFRATIGAGTLIALEATRDALWIFCTDGLYRLSGAGGQWRVDTVDTTLVLSSPRASCVLREVVYCYTNQGFGRVTDAGFEQLSERIVGDLLPGAEYTETAAIILERNEVEDEIVIRLSATEVYIYSTRENAYTTMGTLDVTAMAYARYPVSGSAALAFGRSPSGSTPRYELWNSTASWLAATARFQPVFAQDPFTAKQWTDGTYVFSADSGAPSITPAWNGTTGTAGQASGSPKYVSEARVIFGVPRRAAIGNAIAPGFNVGARAVPTRFYALSMRYRQFGEQNLKK
jgi:hypothetical protein